MNTIHIACFAALALCGCESAGTIIFEEPTECSVDEFPESTVACYRPSACCDIGPAGFAALCAEYYPDQPTPVMCAGDIPMQHRCALLSETQRFNCEFGHSVLACCDID